MWEVEPGQSIHQIFTHLTTFTRAALRVEWSTDHSDKELQHVKPRWVRSEKRIDAAQGVHANRVE
jgi:hypothetical protein